MELICRLVSVMSGSISFIGDNYLFIGRDSKLLAYLEIFAYKCFQHLGFALIFASPLNLQTQAFQFRLTIFACHAANFAHRILRGVGFALFPASHPNSLPSRYSTSTVRSFEELPFFLLLFLLLAILRSITTLNTMEGGK